MGWPHNDFFEVPTLSFNIFYALCGCASKTAAKTANKSFWEKVCKRVFDITYTVEEFSFQNMMGVKKGMTDTGLTFAKYMKMSYFFFKITL